MTKKKTKSDEGKSINTAIGVSVSDKDFDDFLRQN